MTLRKAFNIAAPLTLVLLVTNAILGLFVTPPDRVQGNLARLLYVHPAVAWVSYLAFGVTTIASLLYLWRPTRSLRWDRIAFVSTEVGVLFTALTLITGSIWGRPAWGVWWTWDARLTTTAILLLLYMGYLALRGLPSSAETRAKRSAIVGIVSFIDVPIVHESVIWWRTLHQGPTVATLGMSSKIHGIMAWTLLLSFIAFTLLFVTLFLWRYRLALLEAQRDQILIDMRKSEITDEKGSTKVEELLASRPVEN